MSKLEELIQQYCPDGVEYVKLGDFATQWYRGAGIKKDEISQEGIPCIRYGEIHTIYKIWFDKCISHTDEAKQPSEKYADYGDILFAITSEDIPFIGNSVAYMGKERIMVGGDIVVMKHTQNPKYISYALSTIDAVGQKGKGKVKSKVVHTNVPSLKEIVIPVPPLPVQEEIVRILDTFTELQAELQAELQKRLQQYNYYRDFLLSFEGRTDVQWKRLEDLGVNLDRKRKPIASGKRVRGNIPYYGASGIVDYVKGYIFDGDYLLVSEDGANLLTRTYPIAFSIHGKTWVNNHAHVIEFKERATRKYVEYYLNSIDLSLWISAGAQPKLTQDSLNKLTIPVPPLAEQQRVVSILDRFDTLTTDLTQGLPAEIEKRRQQYEYYRDKLLTFKRKEA